MARKDIEVRIRAKDEASRNAKKVADALKQLSTTGNNLGTTGTKVGGAMSAIGDGLGKLQGKLGGIDNLSKLVSELNKTTSVVGRLEKELSDSKRVLEEQSQKTRAAAQTSAQLKARIEAETAAQKQRADRIKQLTDTRNKDTKSVLDAARAAEKLQKVLDTGKGGYSGPRYPTKGVGRESGAPISSARESAAVLFRPEIEAGLGGKAALTAEVNALKAANDASKTSISALRGEIKAASADERQFAADTEKASIQVTKLNEKLLAATGTWSKLDDEASKASKELGGIALSQEAVAKATAKAEDELRKQAATLAAYERIAAKKLVGGGTIGDPTQRDQARAQADALRQAREEVKLLRDEQTRLDAAMRSGSGNVSAQVDAYDRMSRAVKVAEEQVRKLEIQQRLAQSTGASGYAKWAKVYNPITNGAQAAVQSQERLNQSTRRTVAEAGKIAPMAQRNTNELRNQSAASDKASVSLLNFGRNTRTTLSFMQRMRGELLALTSGYLGFYAAISRGQAAMGSFQAVEKAQNRLGVAFQGDTAKVAREINFLNAQADRLGFTFESLADGYGKISIAASSANFTVEDTRKLFTSLAEAARVNGSSMDEMNGVLRAVDQMLSKGKIQAEELRGQLGDRMSGAFKLFADGLGMTTAELDKAMKAGEVYADRETMLKFAARLEEMYGKNVPAAMKALAGSLGTFQRDMEKMNVALANGFVPAVKEALAAFHSFANSAEGAEAFRAVGEAAGQLISILAQIPQHFGLIITAAKVLVAIGLGKAFASVATGVVGAVSKMRSYSTELIAASAAGAKLSATQRTLGLAYATLTTGMGNYQARLRASTSQSALATVGTRGLAASVGLLRVALIGAGSALRTVSALMGGPIGIAITAIGLGIMAWQSDAQEATKAMQEHERQVNAVKAAYDAATDKSGEWYKNVAGVTLAEGERNLARLKAAYDRHIRNMVSSANLVRRTFEMASNAPDNLGLSSTEMDQIKSFLDLVDAMEAGTLSVEEFRNQLDEIYQSTTHEGLKRVSGDMIEMTAASADGEGSMMDLSTAMEKQEKVIAQLKGEHTDLVDVVEETHVAFDKTKFVEEYTKAIDDLKSKIPSLADEMKRLKEQTELNQAAWKGLVAAWNSGDYSKILEIGKLWAQATGAINDAVTGKMLDSYGAGDKDVINRIIYVEAGQNGTGPSTSSARGIGQFTEGTWLQWFGKIYPELSDLSKTQKLALRTSEEHANKILTAFTRDNQNTLLRAGVNAGPKETYLAHFLGAGDAVKVLLANPEELAANIVKPDSVAANPSVFKPGMTIQDLIGWSAKKMGDGSAITGTGQTENEKEREDEAKATKKRLADLDHQIAQQRLINDGKEREAAIEDAIRAARAENKNISDAELATIREQTGALWDQQNARHAIEQSEERVNQLYTLRQQLLEQIKMAQESGDLTQVTALKTELEGVNGQLLQAIPSLIAMWEKVGGPEADAAIAKLKTMQMSVKANKDQVGLFGLSMSTWQGIFDSAIDGVVGAFDAMAQAIANGENAFKAFGVAVLQTLAQVLQQIGVAILRMMILKALQGFGGPIGTFATAALGGGATGHTGGVVGSKGIGSGNAIRNTGWVHNALSYHTGGIAGLRPDEVSATLRKGEEILTEEDPRHRDNLGGERNSTKGTAGIKQVLAIGDDEIANAMTGGSGEKVVMTHIRRNRTTIRQELGID